MVWGLGINIRLNFIDRVKDSLREKRAEKRPVAMRKIAENFKRREEGKERLTKIRQVETKLSGIRKPEFYDLEDIISRKLSFFPGCELNLITEESAKTIEKRERFAG